MVFVSICEVGEGFYVQGEYVDFVFEIDYKCDLVMMGWYLLDEVLSVLSLKFVLCYFEVLLFELFVVVCVLGLIGFYVIYSGVVFVEVVVEGIIKVVGLVLLCENLGVVQVDIFVFGDVFNDVEMFVWVGCGVVMGNVYFEVWVVVDEVMLSNEEDGVVVVIEWVLVGLG